MATTGELGYAGPLYDGLFAMTDVMLGPSPMHIKYVHWTMCRPDSLCRNSATTDKYHGTLNAIYNVISIVYAGLVSVTVAIPPRLSNVPMSINSRHPAERNTCAADVKGQHPAETNKCDEELRLARQHSSLSLGVSNNY